jgi:hypothetical protein
VGPQRIIERERRWAAPAAVAAFTAAVLVIGSIVVEQSADLPSGEGDVARLRAVHDQSSTLLVAAILRAVGFVALCFPLLYLFRAAQARNPRVQAVLVGFCFIGPLLLAAQAIIAWSAFDEIASDLVADPPRTESYASFARELGDAPESIETVTVYTDAGALDVERTDGTFVSVDYPPDAEDRLLERLDSEGVTSDEDSDGEPGDALAEHLADESTAQQVAGALLFPAVFGLIVPMVYVPLQAMRAGLLPRFFGTLGMALGASLILLPFAFPAILLWFVYLGMLFLGVVPRGRPPAWDAGVAVPWPVPGEEPEAPPGAPIEGEAREIGTGDGSAQSAAERAKKRKRKRRG